MGHLGFSYVGLLYLLMLFIPNIIWTKNKPIDYDSSKENRRLLLFERVGQVCVTCCLLIFSDFTPSSFAPWSLWFLLSALLMLLYEICWIRYFIGEHTEKAFYRQLCIIPIPLASLPVAAFLFLGIYGRVVWLIASVVILGIGHIGIHLQHCKQIKNT